MRMFYLLLALHALLILILSYLVGHHRQRLNAFVPGEEGDALLKKAIRAHGNAVEYIPLAMIMLFALAYSGLSDLWIALLGGSFLLGRIVQALGLYRQKHPNPVRFIGNLITGLYLLIASIMLIYHAFN